MLPQIPSPTRIRPTSVTWLSSSSTPLTSSPPWDRSRRHLRSGGLPLGDQVEMPQRHDMVDPEARRRGACWRATSAAIARHEPPARSALGSRSGGSTQFCPAGLSMSGRAPICSPKGPSHPPAVRPAFTRLRIGPHPQGLFLRPTAIPRARSSPAAPCELALGDLTASMRGIRSARRARSKARDLFERQSR